MEEENTNKKGKRYKKKKMNKWLKIFLIFLAVIILLAVVLIGSFIGGKLSKITFKDLDESDLSINENLYSEVAGLTQKEYEQVINIILLGSDSKDMNNTYAGNSDCQMIISINPKYKSIKLISIPRDTAADIEGVGRYKINGAFATGKEQLALKTINKTFDLNLKEYVTINISSMYDIINELGGVEVDITKDEMNWINEYVDMFYGFSGRPTQKVTKYGRVILTGEQAAAHAKERKAGANGDFSRTRRQRDIFTSMLKKISQKSPSEISKIMDMILSQVTTNVDVAKYSAMLPEFLANKDAYLNNIISVNIPEFSEGKEKMVNGVYLFEADIETCKKKFIKYMYEM